MIVVVEVDPTHCAIHGHLVAKKIKSLDEQDLCCKIKYDNYGQPVAKL